MREWKRIFTQRRLCLGLLLILFLNGVWFIREQASRHYGLDLSLPSTWVSSEYVSQTNTVSQAEVDAYAAYTRYLQRLEQAKGEPVSQRIDTLEQELGQLENALTVNPSMNLYDLTLDYIAVHNVLLQARYLQDYPTFLEDIQTSKDNLLSFSIFHDTDSFSGRNILKTASDFEALNDVTLTMEANGAVEAFMYAPLTDYLMVVLSFLLVVSFSEERKQGLWSLIHATPQGRLHLTLYRALALLGGCVLCVLLLYGETWMLGLYVYGGAGDFGRAVQSIEVLGKLPALFTVGQFLLHYVLLRIATMYLVSLLLWLLLSWMPHEKFAFLVVAGIMCLEYALYTFLPVQSSLNPLKYWNLFTYISLSDLYTEYLNINVFGYPWGIRMISELALLPLCVLFLVACIMTQCLQKPYHQRDWVAPIAATYNHLTDKVFCGLGLWGMEWFKTLWTQKGVVVILFLLYVTSQLSFSANIPVSSAVDRTVRQYTAALEGEITPDTFAQIGQMEEELQSTINTYEEAKIAYQNGEMERSQLNVYAHEAEVAQMKQEAISIVRQRVENLADNANQLGITPWLVESTPYERIYGEAASKNQQNASTLALLALVFLLAGNLPYERQAGMMPLLIASPRGRNSLLRRKVAVAGLWATVVWTVVYGWELHTLLSSIPMDTLSAPIQSLPFLERLTIPCTIQTFLFAWYLVRLMLLLGGAILILALSISAGQRTVVSYAIVLGVLVLPSLLYFYMGIHALKYVSFALPLQLLDLVQVKHPLGLLGILCGGYIILLGLSMYRLRRALKICR